MKEIVIDIQLAPCSSGIDIFKANEELLKSNQCYMNIDGARDTAISFDEFPELKQITKPVLAQLVIKVPREEGYYWTKASNTWSVRYWNCSMWDGKYNDNYFAEIDERRIERTEQ